MTNEMPRRSSRVSRAQQQLQQQARQQDALLALPDALLIELLAKLPAASLAHFAAASRGCRRSALDAATMQISKHDVRKRRESAFHALRFIQRLQEQMPQTIAVGGECVGQCSVGVRDGVAISWGFCEFDCATPRFGLGRLGDYDFEGMRQSPPTKVRTDARIIGVSSGFDHVLMLTAEGRVLRCGGGCSTWGVTIRGGVGADADYEIDEATRDEVCPAIPVPMDGLGGRKVVQVSAGGYFSVFLDAAGHVFECGSTPRGVRHMRSPRRVALPQRMVCVSASKCSMSSCVLAVAEDGTLYGWGSDGTGILAIEFDGQRIYAPFAIDFMPARLAEVSTGACHAVGVSLDGTAYEWGMPPQDYGTQNAEPIAPRPVPGLEHERVVHCAVDLHHSAVITSTGLMYTWGMNDCGQLGHGTDLSDVDRNYYEVDPPENVRVKTARRVANLAGRVSSVAIGECVSAAQVIDGATGEATIVVFGDNQFGQCGLGQEEMALYDPEPGGSRRFPTHRPDGPPSPARGHGTRWRRS